MTFKNKNSFFIIAMILLGGCFSLPESSHLNTPKNDLARPSWQLSGKGSITIPNSSTEVINFTVTKGNKNVYLDLSSLLGLRVAQIIIGPESTFVNGKLSSTTYVEWMETNYGWHFPIFFLEHIFFGQGATSDQWLLDIKRYKKLNNHSHPELLILTHPKSGVRLKIVLNKISTSL